MINEEWKTKGQLLQEVAALRNRVAQLEQIQHKKTEKVSSASEEEIRSFLDNVTEGVLITNLENGKFLTGNRRICKMLGYDLEEIVNLEVTDIYQQEDRDHVREQLEKHRIGEATVSKAVLIKRRHGGVFLADIASAPFTFAGEARVMSVFRKTPPRHVKKKIESSTSADSFVGSHLTPTEVRVLRLIVSGKSCREIAQFLHRSTRTIENHRAHVMGKLEVDNSVALIKKAIALGLVDLRKEQ